jgi:hypothetical protein
MCVATFNVRSPIGRTVANVFRADLFAGAPEDIVVIRAVDLLGFVPGQCPC